MSDRWDATLTPDAPTDSTAIPSWLDVEETPLLAEPTVLHSAAAPDGPLVYGLVARVALSRPGFGFRVEHDLPAGVELIEARPRATVVGDHLIWQMGRVDPGQEVRLEIVVKLEPGVVLDPAELANFTATYSQNLYLQAPVVRPRLAARVSGPTVAEVGTNVEFLLDVANTGNWIVSDARAMLILPDEFTHPSGPKFRFDLGVLKPGEYRRITVPALASVRGAATIRAEISGPADHQAIVELGSRVTGPALELTWHGPSVWSPRREAPLRLTVRNAGDGLALNASARVSLPAGLELVSCDGHAGPDGREILWPLGELPAGQSRVCTLTVLPVTPGELPIRGTVSADGVTTTEVLKADIDPDSTRTSPVLNDYLASLRNCDAGPRVTTTRVETTRGEPHLVFSLGETDYAVPLTLVREVGRPPACTPLPNVPDWLLGVANVRGDVVSLVDLRAFLNDGPPPIGNDPRLLVVAAGEITAALVVDRVIGLRDLPLERKPAPVSTESGGAAPYLNGIAECDGRLLAVLDLDRLLNAPALRAFGAD